VRFTITRSGDDGNGGDVLRSTSSDVDVDDEGASISRGVFMLTANARLPTLSLPIDVTYLCLNPSDFVTYVQRVLVEAVKGS
jgi:hypothetical protein